MKWVALSVLLLALPTVVAAPAPFPKTAKRTDLDKMQGDWECARVWKVAVTGDRLCWRSASQQVHEYRIQLLRNSSPPAMILVYLGGDYVSQIGVSFRAIYRIEVGRIVIREGLTPTARPYSFDSNCGCREECIQFELYRQDSGR
jgi:hypothetical protein